MVSFFPTGNIENIVEFMKPYYLLRQTMAFSLCLLLISILGCVHAPPPKKVAQQATIFHQESTVYFANKTASISMRASFSNALQNKSSGPLIVQPLIEGYKLQFRTLKKDNLLIKQASIIVGGKKIVIADDAFFVPYNKGISLSLSLEDTQYISQHDNAILGFNYDNESLLVSIKSHKLSNFKIQ
ncbi:MAG: hypothetical protein ACI9NY_000536 [Kiritimatiellia bacterium]|jgi:hypothetical protein